VDSPPAYGDTLDPRDSIARIRRYVDDALEERADPASALRRHPMGGGGGGGGGGGSGLGSGGRSDGYSGGFDGAGSGDGGVGGSGGEARGPPRGRGKTSGFDCRVDMALCLLPPRRPQEPEAGALTRPLLSSM